MREDSLPLRHFEALYARSEDPWHYASSAYEREKYAATLAALPHPRYRNGFEIGCSIGVMTDLLAERCDRLLAVEPVAAALEAAIMRNRRHHHVRFAPLFVPEQWPDGQFDLIVLSEVLDYLGREALAALAERLSEALEPQGDLILVHWIGKKRHAAALPSEASEILIQALADIARPSLQRRNADYRLDVLSRS
jgi:cyclopropane fatty-acyl-phospholipid synthase-like methyltransferase